MAEIIKMPKLSDTMEEGVVAKWHKKIGDQVSDGDLLAEIETDKATMEYETFQEGELLYQGVEEGGTAAVDAILAIVGKKGEDYSSLLNGAKAPEAVKSEVKEVPAPAVNKAISQEKVAATLIRMPKLSDTMKEGTVAAWHKNIGDNVNSGDLLAEIETDKATMEFESFEDGTLLYQGVKSGDSAEVDAILAIVGEKGANFQVLIDNFSNPIPTEEPAAAEPVKMETVAGEPIQVLNSSPGNRLKISPLAQKMAKERNINLGQVNGSGDGGRIIKRDIENFVAVPNSGTASASVSSAIGQESYEEVAVSQMRKTIAKRLGESKFTAPHFYLTIDLDMDNAIAARKAINELPDVKVSFNDLVIKSAAAALKKHPAVNSSWLGDKIRINHHVHIGVAVAVEDGLLVPVVRHADVKQLSAITAEVRDFAQRAREKKLQPSDWEGSTFSISNLGMFGIEEFTAIVNPPNACILAVGAIRETAVVKNGQVVPGNRMKVTLSCDHRVVDGATGSEFLQSFKMFIENPVTILG